MRFGLLVVFLALMQVSLAISTSCIPQDKLNMTAVGCLQSGQDAMFIQDGVCTIVACAPKTPGLPRVCYDSAAISAGVQKCLNISQLGEVFGTVNCSSFKCVLKSAFGHPLNQSNSTSSSIIDTLTYYGNKYSTVIGGVVTAAIAIIGWHFANRKKSKMSEYLTHIDGTYSSFKTNAHECEAELRKIRKSMTEDLKKGRIEESTYSILEKRIDDYLAEIRSSEKSAKVSEKADG